MRKSLKIILFISAIVLLAVVLLYFNRNDLVSYGLRRFVSAKSDSTTALTLEKVELDPLKGSITIYRPALYFTDFYLNDNKDMKVNTLSFEKLGVYNVSLFKLLLGRGLEANKILVLKPAVLFEKHGMEVADTSASDFDADRLFELLNTNSRSFTDTKLKVYEIEIGFGAVHLHMDSIPDNMFSVVDFSLLLKSFETQLAPDLATQNRIFYSDEVIFQVKDLYKHMEGGYDLHIDSVSYNSILESFVTSGFSMLPYWQPGEKKDKTGIVIDRLKLDGVGVAEIRGLKKLHPGTLEVSGATITNYIKAETPVQKQPKPDTGQLKRLPKLLNDVILDSLLVNGLSFLNIKGEGDTSLVVENIQLHAGEIRFDSTLLDNPLEKLIFGEMWLTTEQVNVMETEKGLHAGFNAFEYSTTEKQLKVNGLRFSSDSLNVLGPVAVVHLTSLPLGGFSLKSFLHKKKQQLSLSMEHPVVDISLTGQKTGKETPPGNTDNQFVKLLVLQDIDIRDGVFKLSGKDELKLAASGISVAAHGLDFTIPDSLHHVNFNKFRLAIDGMEAGFSNGTTQIKSGAVLFDSLYFEMNALQGNYHRLAEGKKETASFDLSKLRLFAVDLNTLFSEKRVEVGAVVLDGPVLRADFAFPDTTKDNSQPAETVSPLLPVGLQIGELRIKDGRLNLGLTGESDTIRALTDFEISLGEIVSNDSSVLTWLGHSDWQALLRQTVVTSGAYDLQAGRILLKPDQSVLRLKQFTIESKPNHRHKQRKFEMERISLPALSVSGLDYQLLIDEDSVRFSKLTIDAPELSIRLFPGETAGSKTSQTTTFDIVNRLQMAYDTIDLNNLHLKLEMHTDTSHTLVQVHDLSIEHMPRKHSGDNLMPELAAQLDEVTVSDSVKNTYLRFNDLDFDPALKKLTISDVDWMQNQEKQHAIGGTDKKSTAIHLSKIEFTGAYLKQTMPTHLGFSKLRFSDIDITVTDNEKGKSLASQELEFNISSLKQYADLLSRLTIDTTVLEDVSVHYRTVGAD